MSNSACSLTGDFDVFSQSVGERDEVAAIANELYRQQNQIELIASENIVGKAVLKPAARL